MLAEWEPQKAILMALPHAASDWNYILPRALEQYALICRELTSRGINVIMLCADRNVAEETLADSDSRFLTLIDADYNDTWTRDYGPITVIKDDRRRLLDFGFNGWGLKFASDKDNLVNLHLRDNLQILPQEYRNERDFVLEGGSLETDGQHTLLTTTRCLCSPNRNGGKSKAELNKILLERLGMEHILWLDYGYLEGDDTDSHIDTLARMAPDDTIIFTGCRNVDDPQFEQLLRMRAQLTMFRTIDGNPYNLVELPLPDPIYSDEGERLPATYANYLVTDHVVFVPVYDQPDNDTLACNTLRIAFPGHEIVGIDCRTLIEQHGSLHCATMQLYR